MEFDSLWDLRLFFLGRFVPLNRPLSGCCQKKDRRTSPGRASLSRVSSVLVCAQVHMWRSLVLVMIGIRFA